MKRFLTLIAALALCATAFSVFAQDQMEGIDMDAAQMEATEMVEATEDEAIEMVEVVEEEAAEEEAEMVEAAGE